LAIAETNTVSAASGMSDWVRPASIPYAKVAPAGFAMGSELKFTTAAPLDIAWV